MQSGTDTMVIHGVSCLQQQSCESSIYKTIICSTVITCNEILYLSKIYTYDSYDYYIYNIIRYYKII